jgi:uncharacterized protein YkwD
MSASFRQWIVAVGCLISASLAPTTVFALDPGATAPPKIETLEGEMVRRVNEVRRQHGLPPLKHDPALGKTARDYSCLMADERFLSHESPRGGTLADRARESGKLFRVIGENLAMNVNAREPLAAALRGWMKSRTHRDNILGPEYTETGVGICRRDTAFYFTQIFLRPPM